MKKFLYSCMLVGVFVLIGAQTTHAACNTGALSSVSFGQSGTAVTNMQECLMSAGFSIPAGATGYYGAQTQTAVKEFYRTQLGMGDWHGNNVGPQGRSTLAGSTGVQTQTRQTSQASQCSSDVLSEAKFGVSGAQVTALQSCLMSAGFSIPAGATGYYGAQTQSAVKEMYRARMGISDWHGNSVGPQALAVLAGNTQSTTPKTTTKITGKAEAKDFTYKQVSSSDELLEYVEASDGDGYFGMGVTNVGFDDVDMMRTSVDAPMMAMAESVADTSAGAVQKTTSSRHSETNVQVSGIDEPDIVKTDGEHLYISSPEAYLYRTTWEDDVAVSRTELNASTINVVDAFPLADLGVISTGDIEEAGEMLLLGDTLVIFASDGLVAYDVSDPASPVKEWTRNYGENVRLVTARAMDGEVFMVTSTYLSRNNPCPVVPLMDAGMRLSCRDVWVPKKIEHLNTSYSVMKLDPDTGDVDDSITFAGKQDNTVVAMFEDNIYITHKEPMQIADVMYTFFTEELSDLISTDTMTRVKEIWGYDISDESKMNEISVVLMAEMAGMSDNERLLFETELENRGEKYITEHMRDIYRTAISRISTKTLGIKEMKTIPGYLLNQFSLDEYDGYLRTAVTVGERWGMGTQVNDVYVLNDELEIVGSVLDLGLTEQIYSARFIGDRGYVVTFRQIDPFYVLDLGDPENPELSGELKIPGYSSYLEAIDNDTVLGVGEENNRVKVSLFDVSNPKLPEESDVYRLDEYWSEVGNNHHAFLKDSEHKVVFIPASNGGYVLSYSGDQLSLKAAVSGYGVRRAIYIDDYLYIVGESMVTVLDENTWEEEATLEF